MGVVKNYRRLSPNSKLLLAGHAAASVAMIGCHIFASTYILKVTESLREVGLYQIAVSLGITGAYVLAGRACKRGHTLPLYISGLVLYFLFFILFAIFRTELISLHVFLGVQYGIAAGLYWLPYGIYRIQLSCKDTRLHFFSFEKATNKGVSIVCPFLFGVLIWHSDSYTPLFVFAAVILALFIPFSRRLKQDKLETTPYGVEDLKSEIKEESGFSIIYAINFLLGFSVFGAVGILVNCLVFLSTGSELQLGMVASILPIVSILTSLFVQRIPKAQHPTAGITAATLFTLATCLMCYHTSFVSILIFALVNAACIPVLDVLREFYTYNILDKGTRAAERSKLLIEHCVAKEVFYGAGRIASMSLLLFIPSSDVYSSLLKGILVILAAAVIVSAFLLSALQTASVSAAEAPAT